MPKVPRQECISPSMLDDLPAHTLITDHYVYSVSQDNHAYYCGRFADRDHYRQRAG